MSKTKTNRKTQDLHIRVSKREKDRLFKEAGELEISISDYVRQMILKRHNELPSSKITRVIAICQDIITYVQEKHGCEDDEELAERIDKLWNIL